MVDTEYANDLKARLTALSPTKRAWLEQRLRAPLKKESIGKSRPEVVQLQVGSGGLPVYFIYAGTVEIELARAMGVGYPIFGIEIPWPLSWRNAAIESNAAALPTMEQLVAPFVAALSNHVRSAPCVLAGYCFAGVMAFEAAHQLQRLGGKVEMVMLLHALGKRPPLLSVARSKLRKGWKQALNKARAKRSVNLIGVRLRSTWLMFWWILEKSTKRIIRFFRRPSSNLGPITSCADEQHDPVPWELITRLYEKPLKSYDFRLLDSHGFLFRTSDGQNDPRAYDDSLGWKDLFAKGLEIISVTGDHHTMMSESHRLTLARKMTEVLNRYSGIISFRQCIQM
jgi:thioesterase domain-containing protein